MNALSKDLRQRILNYALTHPVRETADIFQASPNTVRLLKNLWYETGAAQNPAHPMPSTPMRFRPKGSCT